MRDEQGVATTAYRPERQGQENAGGPGRRPEASVRLPVSWHRKARDEYDAIDPRERVAIQNVIEKLRVDGPGLRAPHQSAVLGDVGEGLRELRPRQGRSRWRPIYRRIGEVIVILAVAPEAEIDAAGYNGQIAEAQKRRRRVERSLG